MSEDQSSVVTLKVRVTPEFREKIVETAKSNNRSMNQEIVSRLEDSFLSDTIINEQSDRIELLTTLLKENHKMMSIVNEQLEAMLSKK